MDRNYVAPSSTTLLCGIAFERHQKRGEMKETGNT